VTPAELTAELPVKPTLSTRRSASILPRASYVVGPSATTVLSTPSGTPAAWNSAVNASATAGVDSAGFQTTALPHSRAGTRYQDGTATGKFGAVTMAATPTGVRKVKSCLAGISLGTVWP